MELERGFRSKDVGVRALFLQAWEAWQVLNWE